MGRAHGELAYQHTTAMVDTLGIELTRQQAGLVCAALAATALFASRPSLAQDDCPTAQTAKSGFVVERNERQKSEVSRDDKGVIHTVMRYNGTTLLETSQFEGVFSLERLDRGRRTTYEPSEDLKGLFPLKPGQQAHAKFITEHDGQYGRLYVELDVKGTEDLSIGPCKYAVLRIDRRESTSAVPPQFVYAELYSPDLKLIVGREYKRQNGESQLIKYDRIYPLKK
jgi:hypothetical protein